MSVGVGRGRGRLPPASAEPPRRPGTGRGAISNQLPASQLSELLSQSSISHRQTSPAEKLSNPNITTVLFFDAIDNFFSSNPSEDDIRRLVQDILEKAVTSDINVDCVCQCMFLSSRHKTHGDKLFTTFFAELQIKFEGRNQIRSFGEVSFWRFVKFFSSVCYYTRNMLYRPFDELIDALLELIKTPLPVRSNKDDPVLVEELSTLAIAVVRYVSFIPVTADSEDPAKSRVRDLLYSSGPWQGESLLWLLACLESANGSGGASPQVLRYYLPKLGSGAAAFALKEPTVDLPASASTGKYNFKDIGYSINFV